MKTFRKTQIISVDEYKKKAEELGARLQLVDLSCKLIDEFDDTKEYKISGIWIESERYIYVMKETAEWLLDNLE